MSAGIRDALAMGKDAAHGRREGREASGRSESSALKLPSFLVVGPPRTGTSWVHEVLADHANLPDPTKETRFFDLHFDRGLRWYLDHFPAAHNGYPRGEVAPTYFRSASARDRIAQTIPDVKLVFIFRHPIQRLVSLYRLKRAYGRLSWTLDEALERDPELVESSLYATNLREWQNKFPAEQLSINLFEDLSSNPQQFIDRLTDFLGIPQFQLAQSQLEQVYSTAKMTEPRSFFATKLATAVADWCKARKLDNVVAGVKNSQFIRLFLGGGAPFPDIPIETLRKVRTQMLREIEELEAILGRDLSHWKTPPSLP